MARISTTARTLGNALSLPWNYFVAAFLYYALLTAIVISGADFSASVMFALYLLPALAYVAALLNRAAHALAAITIDIAPTPQTQLR